MTAISGRRGRKEKEANLMLENKKHEDKVDLYLDSTFHPKHLILTTFSFKTSGLLKEMSFLQNDCRILKKDT